MALCGCLYTSGYISPKTGGHSSQCLGLPPSSMQCWFLAKVTLQFVIIICIPLLHSIICTTFVYTFWVINVKKKNRKKLCNLSVFPSVWPVARRRLRFDSFRRLVSDRERKKECNNYLCCGQAKQINLRV